jgi:ATP-dependent Clp protease protease subunit
MQKLVVSVTCFASLVYGRRVLQGIQDSFASGSSQDRRALTSILLAANPALATRGTRRGASDDAGRHNIPLMSGSYELQLPEESQEEILQRVRELSPEARLQPQMQRAAANSDTIDGVRIGPPPDLPSLLLKNRIVYIGSALVPEVTELIVAELLYLSSQGPKDIFMYINSPGSPVTYDAFAITDTMDYIKPEIQTICVGTAYGTAAMLLSNGAKGKRVCLPNAKVMLQQPRGQAQGQATDIANSAREILKNRQEILELLSQTTGQTVEKLKADSSRTKYFKAEEAVEYGLVDRVIAPEDLDVKPDAVGR